MGNGFFTEEDIYFVNRLYALQCFSPAPLRVRKINIPFFPQFVELKHAHRHWPDSGNKDCAHEIVEPKNSSAVFILCLPI